MAAETKVTRIKAKDTSSKVTKNAPSEEKKPTKTKKRSGNIFIRAMRSIGGYFKGAWVELRQVRWPTRKATWGLTIAVIAFSLFFVILIALLDLLFNFIFQQVFTN